MRKRLFLLILVLPFIFGFSFSNVYEFDLRPAAYESITVADTALGFTTTYLVPGVTGVFCTLETAQVRWRMDGTDPTSAEGHLLEVGQTLFLRDDAAIRAIMFIRTGSTSGVLKVTYLKRMD